MTPEDVFMLGTLAVLAYAVVLCIQIALGDADD